MWIILFVFVGIIAGITLQHYHAPRKIVLFTRELISQRRLRNSGVHAENGIIKLGVRRYIANKEIHEHETIEFDINNAALVVIDAWDDSSFRNCNPSGQQVKRFIRHRKDKLLPLIELARRHKINIVHASHENDIADEVEPRDNEYIVDSFNMTYDTQELDNYLKLHKIRYLFYAGYASNYCLLARPTGIIKMREFGYNIIVVRDCVLAFELPATLKGEYANEVAINMVEAQWGHSTTAKQLEEALEKRK